MLLPSAAVTPLARPVASVALTGSVVEYAGQGADEDGVEGVGARLGRNLSEQRGDAGMGAGGGDVSQVGAVAGAVRGALLVLDEHGGQGVEQGESLELARRRGR